MPGDLTRLPPDRFEYVTLATGESGRNDAFGFAGDLGRPVANQVIDGLSFNYGDTGDWYVIKTPDALKRFGDATSGFLAGDAPYVGAPAGLVQVIFDQAPGQPFVPGSHLFLFAAQDTDPGPGLAVEPVEFFAGVPDYYLLHVVNPFAAVILGWWRRRATGGSPATRRSACASTARRRSPSPSRRRRRRPTAPSAISGTTSMRP